MSTDAAAATIDTSTLPIVADTTEQGDSPQELQARFDALMKASAAPEAKPEPKAKDEAKELPTDQQQQQETPFPEEKKEDDDAPANTTPKAKETWATLKAKAAERDKVAAEKEEIAKEREALKAELEALRKDDPAVYKKQIEEKDKALAAFEEKVALLDVKASREYETAVLQPFAAIGASVAEIAQINEADAGAIQTALLNPDPVSQRKRLTELTAEFTDADRNEIFNHAREVRALTAKAAELEAKAGEAKKELEFRRHQEAETAKKQAESQMTEASKAVWEKMVEKLPLLKDETVAAQVRKTDLDPKDPAMKAYNAYAGMALPVAIKQLVERDAEIAQLKAANTARNGATPKAGTETVTTTEAPRTGLPEGDTVLERFSNYNRAA